MKEENLGPILLRNWDISEDNIARFVAEHVENVIMDTMVNSLGCSDDTRE